MSTSQLNHRVIHNRERGGREEGEQNKNYIDFIGKDFMILLTTYDFTNKRGV